MARKIYCKNCGKEIDEGTRFDSIQEFGFAVCSVKCGLKVAEASEQPESPDEPGPEVQ